MTVAGRDVVRALTDERVVSALITGGVASRAELAQRTGISRPTASESVRRLVELDLARETSLPRQGSGRAGNLIDLGAAVGQALTVVVAPEGVQAQALDARGQVVGEHRIGLRDRKARPAPSMRTLVRELGGPFAVAAVSVADPVDRVSGRAVELVDAPFLTGAIDSRQILRDRVLGAIEVDNDVNWAARAELAAGAPGDFAYLYLGEGLGAAVVSDGAVVHGGHGLVGEIAHVVVAGPRGRAMALTDAFAKLGLRQPDSTALDVDAVRRQLTRDPAPIADAVAGVVAAMVAFADPTEIVIGGPWGSQVVPALRERLSSYPRNVSVGEARVVDDAPLRGVHHGAVALLRERALEQVRGTLGA